MQPFMYYNPTKLYFGTGQIRQLEKQISNYGKKVLLIYGQGSVKNNGVYDQVIKQLNADDCIIKELPGVKSNPDLETVERGINLCIKYDIDFILAIGGGSVIDCSKAVAVGAKNQDNIKDIIMRKKRAADSLPYGSIVTVFGTGAELSLSSVITEVEVKQKHVWHSSQSRAKFSIVDPELMRTVPLKQTVNGIVDSMSHLLEHYFHSDAASTEVQNRVLESILRIIIETAPKLIRNLNDHNSREKLSYISTIALSDQLNMGFVGDWGTHDIAHALGGKFDIPHGSAISIIFPQWMTHVLKQGKVEPFKRLALNVFDIDPKYKTDYQIAEEGIKLLKQLWDSWGIEMSLSEFSISEQSIKEVPELMKKANMVCGNYFQMKDKDIIDILRSSL